jgi:hypothetical protein
VVRLCGRPDQGTSALVPVGTRNLSVEIGDAK